MSSVPCPPSPGGMFLEWFGLLYTTSSGIRGKEGYRFLGRATSPGQARSPPRGTA